MGRPPRAWTSYDGIKTEEIVLERGQFRAPFCFRPGGVIDSTFGFFEKPWIVDADLDDFYA
jgi:hypothetical protein